MSKEYSADIIAQSFIKQYYAVLAQRPELLHRFYKEDSTFSFSEAQGTIDSVEGVFAITEKVRQLSFLESRVDLSEGSIDAQKSDTTSILIVVTGEITLPGKAASLFVQTFLLAGQGGGLSYYCRNSILRLLSAPARLAAPAPVAAPAVVVAAPQPAPAAPAATLQQHYESTTPVQQPTADDLHAKTALSSLEDEEQPAAAEPEADVPEPEAVQEEEEVDEYVEIEVTEEYEELVVEEKTKLWSDVIKKSGPSTVTRTRVVKKTVLKSSLAAQQHLATAALQNATLAESAPAAAKTAAPRGSSARPAAGSAKPAAAAGSGAKPRSSAPVRHTLFVSGVAANVTESDLVEALVQAEGSGGKEAVKRVEIVRDRSMAFVDVDTEAHLQAILARAGKGLEVKGARVKVAEKRAAAPAGAPKKADDKKPAAAAAGSDAARPRAPRRERPAGEGEAKPSKPQGGRDSRSPKPTVPAAAK